MMTGVWMPKAIKDPEFKARLFPKSEQTTGAIIEETEITKRRRRKKVLGHPSTRLSGIQGQLKKRLGE